MSETTTAVEDVTTFRGGSLEELLPRIREQLGPDAVIVRQREGLVGGVGGFFQKKCVEVEARAGGPGIDVYDEEAWDGADSARVLSPEEGPAGGASHPFSDPPPVPPARVSGSADAAVAGDAEQGPAEGGLDAIGGEDASAAAAPEAPVVRNDAATREGLATPAVQELVGQAHPFAEMLADLGPEVEIEAPPKARALVEGMVRAGLGSDLARELVEAVLASALPFASPGRLRTLVRNELALRMPVAPAAAPGPRTLVFIGPAGAGKTAALEAIRVAHEAVGDETLTLVEAPEPGDVPPRAEVHLVLRAGTAAVAAAEAVAGLAPLSPTRLLMTGAGETAHLGGIVDAAIRCDLPLSYVAESAGEIAPADPRALAGRIVP